MNYKKALVGLALVGGLVFGGNVLTTSNNLERKLSGGNQPKKEYVQRDSITAQAMSILGDPQKFRALCERNYNECERRFKELKEIYEDAEFSEKDCAEIEEMEKISNPEESGSRLLDVVMGDEDFLKHLVVIYGKADDAHIASNAIIRMNAGSDAYFKRVYEGTKNFYVKSEALKKMSDNVKIPLIIRGLDEYGKHIRVVEQNPGEFHYYESGNYIAARDALGSVNNGEFLKSIAERPGIEDIVLETVTERLAELKQKK